MGSNNSKEDKRGLRVTKVSPHSPASRTDLQAYTDFVIAISGTGEGFSLETDFYKFVIENEKKMLVFHVYNILTKRLRQVEVQPSRDWPGADFLLGFKVRYESITSAEANMFRVNRVVEPGLVDQVQPLYDFFIAVNEFEFSDVEDLKRKLSLYQKCELVMYNIEECGVRNVTVNSLKGKGLGFEIAQGYLHDLCYLYGLKAMERARQRDMEVLTNGKGYKEVELAELNSTYSLNKEENEAHDNDEDDRLVFKQADDPQTGDSCLIESPRHDNN